MKKRLKRMRKVFSLAESEERRQCREMGRSQQQLDEEINRLEELEAYRQSYINKSASQKSISTARWQDYQNFLTRLQQALGAQEQLVKAGKKNRDARRQQWMVKKQRLDSLERVVDRYRKEETADNERELQKSMDELPIIKSDFDEK